MKTKDTCCAMLFLFAGTMGLFARAQARTVQPRVVTTPTGSASVPETPAYGWQIDRVDAGSAIARIGLMRGDIILLVNNRQMVDIDTHLRFNYESGAKVVLTVVREGAVSLIPVQLENSVGGGALRFAKHRIDLRSADSPREPVRASFAYSPHPLVVKDSARSLTLEAFPFVPPTPVDATPYQVRSLTRIRDYAKIYHQLTAPGWIAANTRFTDSPIDGMEAKIAGDLFCQSSGAAQISFNLPAADNTHRLVLIRVEDAGACGKGTRTGGLVAFADGTWIAGRFELEKGNLMPRWSQNAAQWMPDHTMLMESDAAPKASQPRAAITMTDGAFLVAVTEADSASFSRAPDGTHAVTAFYVGAGHVPARVKPGNTALPEEPFHFVSEDEAVTLTPNPRMPKPGISVTLSGARDPYGPAGSYFAGDFDPLTWLPAHAFPTAATLLANRHTADVCAYKPDVPTGWILWGPFCNETPGEILAFSPDGKFRAHYERNGPVHLSNIVAVEEATTWAASTLDQRGLPAGRVELVFTSGSTEYYVGQFNGLDPEGSGICKMGEEIQPCSFHNGTRTDNTYMAKAEADRARSDAMNEVMRKQAVAAEEARRQAEIEAKAQAEENARMQAQASADRNAAISNMLGVISQGVSDMADTATANNAAVQQRLAQQQAEQQQRADQQQSASIGTSNNNRLCNSAQSTEGLLAQGCGTTGGTANSAAQDRVPQTSNKVTANTSSQQKSAFDYNPSANPNQNAGGTPTGVNTGTAAPANCVYLSDAQPCVSLAHYQQMQSQKQASKGICPASGFVPGVMLRQASDVAVGVPCKPGTPYGPLIATTASGGYTGVTPPDPATAGPSGSGSGSSTTGGPYDPDLNNCVVYFYKNDPITGDHLILQNNCSVRAQVYFYASSQVYGGAAIDPGATDNTYASHDKILAAGTLSIYACPVNDIPRQADGTLAYNGVNNRFLCSRK
jgi:hypothetical protein